jgi:serine O-acetyltransferase
LRRTESLCDPRKAVTVDMRLRTSLSADRLSELAARQVNQTFPDGRPVEASDLSGAASEALKRLEHCFCRIANKYFFDGKTAIFDHLHGDQYAIWLYMLANELHRQSGIADVCKKLFLLNKALHGCDVYYEIAMPSVFLLVHPLGTVLGRARYADFLLVYQRVGVGSNHDEYPTIGVHATLRPGSSVLGRSTIGDYCTIAAGSLLLDRDLKDHSIYIGDPRDHTVRSQVGPLPIWRI